MEQMKQKQNSKPEVENDHFRRGFMVSQAIHACSYVWCTLLFNTCLPIRTQRHKPTPVHDYS